jgi:hypothetical protein
MAGEVGKAAAGAGKLFGFARTAFTTAAVATTAVVILTGALPAYAAIAGGSWGTAGATVMDVATNTVGPAIAGVVGG